MQTVQETVFMWGEVVVVVVFFFFPKGECFLLHRRVLQYYCWVQVQLAGIGGVSCILTAFRVGKCELECYKV